jgi:hypothetical protein
MLRSRSRLLLILLIITLLGLALAGSWGAISRTLASWTGEEDAGEQLKGLGALILLRLTRGAPQTAPDVPIAHAGVNPFGVNTFLEQEVEPTKVERSLDMIAEAGFHWIRQEFPWEDIEISAKGDFYDHKWNKDAWAKYDFLVDAAKQRGLEIIARLDNPPAWAYKTIPATGKGGPPDHLEDYGDFVYQVVKRYRGRIRYYQIWNEPNIYPEWGERPVNAAEYVELLRVAYVRAKAADPDCVILSAGLAQTTEKGPRDLDDLLYLQQMYDAGARGYFDILGVMAYGLWTGPTDRRVSAERTNFSRPQLIREIMVRNGDGGKAVWVTEVGWNALPSDFPGAPMFGRVSLEQQARYAVQAYQRAQAEWPWMGVLNYWFFKRAGDSETGQAFFYFRMVEPDFTPLPVYRVLREYAALPPVMHAGHHQESHWALQYSGEWQEITDRRATLGAYRLSQQPGARLALQFRGVGIELATVESQTAGRVRVTVDGQAPRLIDLPAPTSPRGTRPSLSPPLADGLHTIEIEVEQGTVAIDGLIVRRHTANVWLWLLLPVSVVLLALALAWARRRRLSALGKSAPHD